MKLTAPGIQMRFNKSHNKQMSINVEKERLQKADLKVKVVEFLQRNHFCDAEGGKRDQNGPLHTKIGQ